MEGWIDRGMGGWRDGWIEEWVDGGMVGRWMEGDRKSVV